jgi:hypothetical protein
MRPVKPETAEKLYEMIAAERAESNVNYEKVWYYELKLKGTPQPVANFWMECFFTLRKVDGSRDRIVVLRNIHKEATGLVELDSEAFSQPSKFRVWLNDQGNFVWKAGEREMQDLQLDIAHEAAFREVDQVAAFGWHEESGLWFVDDCAFAGGQELLPDEHGVYWWEGRGYQFSKSGKDGQDFRQGRPRMHPGEVLQVGNAAGGERAFSMASAVDAKDEGGALGDLFGELAMRLNEALGG